MRDRYVESDGRDAGVGGVLGCELLPVVRARGDQLGAGTNELSGNGRVLAIDAQHRADP